MNVKGFHLFNYSNMRGIESALTDPVGDSCGVGLGGYFV